MVTRLWRHRLTVFVIVFLFAVWGLMAHGNPQTLAGGWIAGAVVVFMLLRGEVRKRREEEARQRERGSVDFEDHKARVGQLSDQSGIDEAPSARLELDLGDGYLTLHGYFDHGDEFVGTAAGTRYEGQRSSGPEDPAPAGRPLSGGHCVSYVRVPQQDFYMYISREPPGRRLRQERQ
jgi:hypothetical protein